MPVAPDVRVEVRLTSHPRYLQFVRLLAGEGAAIAGFQDEPRGAIELAVVEAFTNVIRHGYKGETDRRVDVRVEAPPGRLKIEIEDWGEWIDPSRIASRPLEEVRPGGLGVHLMKSTMDVVEYRRNDHGGTTLVLEKACRNPSGGNR